MKWTPSPPGLTSSRSLPCTTAGSVLSPVSLITTLNSSSLKLISRSSSLSASLRHAYFMALEHASSTASLISDASLSSMPHISAALRAAFLATVKYSGDAGMIILMVFFIPSSKLPPASGHPPSRHLLKSYRHNQLSPVQDFPPRQNSLPHPEAFPYRFSAHSDPWHQKFRQ